MSVDFKIGDRVGDLLVVEIREDLGHNQYVCKCVCGQLTIVYKNELEKGICGHCHLAKRIRVKGRPERFTEPYKKFRKKVFARAGYKCEVCGSKGKLQAHHKNGWSWAVMERYNPDNGACLCSKCHDHFHSIYGKKHNTVYQYEQFKKRFGK